MVPGEILPFYFGIKIGVWHKGPVGLREMNASTSLGRSERTEFFYRMLLWKLMFLCILRFRMKIFLHIWNSGQNVGAETAIYCKWKWEGLNGTGGLMCCTHLPMKSLCKYSTCGVITKLSKHDFEDVDALRRMSNLKLELEQVFLFLITHTR